ncbi:MAG: DUF4132 domain-containing protein [Planctomycetota bacterium]|nr:MAG: DUF4132 domain-containing protein [Planctomycetota bacterium]
MREEETAKQLRRLAERSQNLAEGDDLPRGALPALFRALRESRDPGPGVAALALRLADAPLVAPTLSLVRDLGAAQRYVAALESAAQEPEAWCSLRQAAALAAVAPRPAWLVEVLACLIDSEEGDPTELALAADPDVFVEALGEVLRLRLAAPARTRCRTSARLAGGALRVLARVHPDGALLPELARRVLVVETRRAGTAEPALALAAVDALEAAPPLQRIRVLQPLLDALERRKVVARMRAAFDAAVAAVGCSREELADLALRRGGADPDGWVRVPLDDGGEVRIGLGSAGELFREGRPAGLADRRAVENAERTLLAARDDLARRLERALVSGRDWSLPLWRELFRGDHPLRRDAAERVIWERRGDAAPTPFVWEGDAARDLFGDEVPLGASNRIGLWHPALADPDERSLWRERVLTRAREGAPRPFFLQAFRPALATDPTELQRFRGREATVEAIEALAREDGWSGCPLRGEGPWDIERQAGGLGLRIALEALTSDFRPTPAQRRAARRRARAGERPMVVPPREAKPRVRLADIEVEGAEDSPATQRALAEAVRALERATDAFAAPDDLFLRAWQQRKWKDPREAWREVVLRYRLGSPALCELRRALVDAYARAEGLRLRLEDRFVIAGNIVVELGTGLCHEGPPKDHLPLWKADERAAAGLAEGRLEFPFARRADPETVAVVERIIGLARQQQRGHPPG